MGFFSGMGKLIKPLVDVPRWLDYRRLTETAENIKNIAINVVTVEAARKKEESFEAALERLKISQTQLKEKVRQFTFLTIFFCILFLATFGFSIYHFFYNRAYLVAFASLVISLIVLTQAFRYHFWVFQIKKRKLGCTFSEYLSSLLGK